MDKPQFGYTRGWLLQGLAAAGLLIAVGGAAAAAAAPQPPRAFCEQRGGTVTETGHPQVYVCCYRQPEKCVIGNTALQRSVVVNLPWQAPRRD